VPAISLPDPRIREERELARFRLQLVKHKSALKCPTDVHPGDHPHHARYAGRGRGERVRQTVRSPMKVLHGQRSADDLAAGLSTLAARPELQELSSRSGTGPS
jgi:hypothetical protein